MNISLSRLYHPLVLEHFRNPRNVGKLVGDDVVTAIAGKASCGDIIKLYLKSDGTIIEDCRFLTFGCGSAIASSSLLTELIKGKTLIEASKISNADISSKLHLPPIKLHCSLLSEEVLGLAIEKIIKKEKACFTA
jgi:nitrogen fixation NifU-like protein